MFGRTALQFGYVDGDEDQFYVPSEATENEYQSEEQAQGEGYEETETEDLAPKSNEVDNAAATENENYNEYDESEKPPLYESVEFVVSNVDRFLQSTAAFVPVQFLTKTTITGWKTRDIEYQPYFTLGDLWESFKEWSAYGVAVPMLLERRQFVSQLYVPYLSAIQLYGQSDDNSSAKPRSTSKDSDRDSYKDSCSDGSSGYESGKKTERFEAVIMPSGTQYLTGDISFRMSKLSINDDKHNTTQEGFSSDDSETRNPQDLLFEYFEQDHPRCRDPFVEKIQELAEDYPILESMRSCDLLPSSWLSVAWYPLYRIPTGPTLKDIDTSFLTYHSLHTPLTGPDSTQAPIVVYPIHMGDVPKIRLTTFGLVSYKLNECWMEDGFRDKELVNSLSQAADDWLNLLQVNHPDYDFFKSHSPVD